VQFPGATIGLCGLLLLTACEEQAGPRAAPPPPEVVVATPLVQEIVDWDEYTGRFEAIESIDVRARVSGYLDSVHFRDGDAVERGQLLFVIDQRPFLISVERAVAQLTQAEAALALAEQELARAENLVSRGALSQATYDERLQEQRRASAALTAARAEVDGAELDLSFTQITAPISGRISRNLVSPGNLIQANESLLTTIVSVSPIHFYFDANEAALLRYTRLAEEGIRPSSRDSPNPVQLQLADERGWPHWGTMDFVENRVDPESGTIEGRAIFNNPNGIFTPGLFARLRLLGSGPYEALMIPEAAIGTDQSYKFVFVLGPDSKPAYRRITLGERRGPLRVVSEGLGSADQVVVEGLLRIRPGQPVTPVPGTVGRDGLTTAQNAE